MPLGVRGTNPIWSEFNLSGKIFDDTYYMYVLQNTLPYIPAIVYHDPNLNTAWTNPIQFLGNGTLPIDIFFESNVVYRLEFRKNNGIDAPSQADPLIYEVNNYSPGSGGSSPIDTVAFASSNQITNPQFTDISFNPPFSLSSVTNPDPIEIGAGWFLQLTGTGSVSLDRLALNNQTETPSNAPYALRINASGWDEGGVVLRQRFNQNGMLWANQIVSAAITARIQGLPQTITASLVDSNGTTVGTMINAEPVNGQWSEIKDYDDIAPPSNPDLPPAAYVDYILRLPSSGDIYITSLQLVVQDLPFKPSFEQDSVERQIDHMFHYYKKPLEYKQIPSYLTGWDFHLNPAQEFGFSVPSAAIGANKSRYIWDQTIAFQSVDNSIGFSRGVDAGLLVASAVQTQFALVQYLPATIARELLDNNLCVNVSALTSAANGVPLTVSLWYTNDAALPDIKDGSNNSLVTALDPQGFPNIGNGLWQQVPRRIGRANAIVRPASADGFNDYPFSGWSRVGGTAINTATYFAIVVGVGSLPAANSVTFNSIGMYAGTIPTRPAPQTPDEVRRECSYYYQTSYQANIIPGTPSSGGFLASQPGVVGSTNDGFIPTSFSVQFRVPMYRPPSTFKMYAASSGTFNRFSSLLVRSGSATPLQDTIISGSWIQYLSGSTAVSFLATSSAATGLVPHTVTTNYVEGVIAFNWVADSRLGT